MVVGVCMCKDEADIIATTVRHMLDQVGEVLVSDNGSTDGTLEQLKELESEDCTRLVVITDPDPAYYQSDKMSWLASRARTHMGAEWVVPFDSDELWFAEGRVADLLTSLPDEAMICEAVLFDHVASPFHALEYRRREALPLRKVACRARPDLTIHQGNHGASYESVSTPLTVTGKLEVRHFPYRSPEQFIRKVRNGAAAYAATDLPEDAGKHWRDYGKLSDDQLREVFFTWFWSEHPDSDPELVHDPCPILSRSA